MNFILFEDWFTRFLAPFSHMHASFEVRCGFYTNMERLVNLLEPTDLLTLVVRDEMKNLIKERFPHAQVNPTEVNAGVWLNGTAVWDKKNLDKVKAGHSYGGDDILFGFVCENPVKFEEKENLFRSMKSVTAQLPVKHISFLWDSISLSHEQIFHDFTDHHRTFKNNINRSAVLVNEENISIGKDTKISAGTIIDASSGPIIIGSGVAIDIGSLIKGPVIIGAGSRINPGSKLRGNVIMGPLCKVGGEVEDSIIHGYSNKQHDGYLGHSYVGEWVNLGANTNTSDLKNTYGSISFTFGDETIDSGKTFIGSMIGDYVRTGISTMLNTGSNIGTGSCLFGNGFQKKYLPPFTWGKNDRHERESFFTTVERMKKRRNIELGRAEKDRLIDLYK